MKLLKEGISSVQFRDANLAKTILISEKLMLSKKHTIGLPRAYATLDDAGVHRYQSYVGWSVAVLFWKLVWCLVVP